MLKLNPNAAGMDQSSASGGADRPHFIRPQPFPAPVHTPGPSETIRKNVVVLLADMRDVARRLDLLGLTEAATKVRALARLTAAELYSLAVDDGPLVQTMPLHQASADRFEPSAA